MAKSKKRKLHAQSKSTKPTHKYPLHQTSAKSKSKPKPHKSPEPTLPFTPESRILLLGEGDFSFSNSLLDAHGCCDLTATCHDSQTTLFEKYSPQAEEHVRALEDEGQTVLYAVDATKLGKDKQLKKLAGRGWETLIFNFPHVGGKSKDVNRQVRFNQELLVNFFTSALPLMTLDGTIVVTLFEGEPYTLWNVRDLARHSGLEVARSFKFAAEAYPGYSHARTLGNIEGGGGWKGEERESRSFVFRRKGRGGDGGGGGGGGGGVGGNGMHPERRAQMSGTGKRKRGEEESSGEDNDDD